jgi:hypothetical protein
MENNKEKAGCQTCKSKNPITKPQGMMIVGVYILIATCYGTVQIVKDIISLFVK